MGNRIVVARPVTIVFPQSRSYFLSQDRISSFTAVAEQQLGTSGAGNHFANIAVGVVLDPAALPGVPTYFCALLTHSGSRGVGYKIATYYSKLAAQETAKIASVPARYEWLAVDSEGGQQYLHAMELAGDFARANHEVIHARFAQQVGLTPVTVIENHHNYAFAEHGVMVHRKGATPAGAGVLGVIPGNMADASYIVRGLGNPESLSSASHGAGRWASRTHAKRTIQLKDVHAYLAERDVLVDGVALDESPQAYKDIERVIALQVEAGLIAPVARLTPIAVRMAGVPGED